MKIILKSRFIGKFTSVFRVIDSCSDRQVASEDVALRKKSR